MSENKCDETMDEVSVATGLEWNEDSKICLFDRFLGEESDPVTFERFENFLERQAQWELACDDEAANRMTDLRTRPMKVQVLLTLDVEDCDPSEQTTTAAEKKRAAAEAIHNAVKHAQANGHTHELAAVVSVMLDEVEVLHVGGFPRQHRLRLRRQHSPTQS